jgi:hypothetical protein
MFHREPKPSRTLATQRRLLAAFPTLAALPDLFDPNRLGPEENDLVNATHEDIHTGRVFWHLTQNMLMRDAVELYFMLARHRPDPQPVKTKAHIVGLWVRGAYVAELGAAIRTKLGLEQGNRE